LWRFAVMGLGVMLLATQLGLDDDSDLWAGVTVTGAALLLIGVPVLLPWLIERVAGQVRGGPSSWVLAVRRLQLDSGTSARVVGGVAVILAGTIALQSVLLSLDAKGPRPTDTKGQQPTVEVTTTWELAPGVLDAIKQADGVRVAHPVQYLFPYEQSTNYSPQNIAVADCATLHDLGGLNGCQDGDVYSVHDEYAPPPSPGMALEFRKYPDTNNEAWEPDKYEVTGNWTVPSTVKEVRLKDGSPLHGPMFVTPGALNGHTVDDGTASVVAAVNKNFTADQLENIRNSVAKYRWQTYVTTNNTNAEQIVDHSTYAVVRKALYAGSVFTLLLASVSMLVLAVEHIRERRRSMAVLTASGIPRGVLARSLLWQVALPIALGVIVAVLIGTGLAALMLRLTRDNLTIDWSGVTLLCVGATALTLLVSAMTLPFLKRATHLTTIRTE
jgi:hypothetical protein